MEVKEKILFDCFPKQEEFLNAVFSGDYKYILYGGAIRGGKTYAGLSALLLLCKFYPGTRWAIVRDTLPTLKRNTIPSFFKICPQKSILAYNQDTQIVRLRNGSQILFFSENYNDDKELNRWKGLEVNGFLLEEANELQEISFYKAIERAGSYIPSTGKKPDPVILLTCNPAQNWIKALFYDRHKKGELPADFLYIPAKITDNPIVMADTEYVESLKNLPRFQYEVFVEGNWDIQLKTGGEFYKCFDLEKHVGDCIYNPLLPLHISFDDNVNPYLPAGIFQINGKIVSMVDEIVGVNPNNTVSAVCKEIIRKYPAHSSGVFIYGDATAKKEDTKMEKGHNFYSLITQNLSQFKPNLRILGSNPSVVMRGNWINTIFEKEKDGIKVIFDKKCHHMINDLVMLKEAADGTKNKEMETDPKTKVRYQKYGHFSDLLDYLLCFAFSGEFSRYQTGASHPLVVGKVPLSKNSY